MMSYVVDVICDLEVAETLVQAVKSAAVRTLGTLPIPANAELSILLTDNDRLRQLNRDYRRRDEVTDVLSFPFQSSDDSGNAYPSYLGDVAIALPKASQQADDAGHTLDMEVQLLTVHGVLHLLGFDHESETEKAKMWSVQAAVLDQLGLGELYDDE